MAGKTGIANGRRRGYNAFQAPVAQLDRALPSEGRGQRFEFNLAKSAQSKQSIKSQQNQWNLSQVICNWLICQTRPIGLQVVFRGPQWSIIGAAEFYSAFLNSLLCTCSNASLKSAFVFLLSVFDFPKPHLFNAKGIKAELAIKKRLCCI